MTSRLPQVATAGQSTHVTVNPQTSDSITPMDVDLQKAQTAWNDISEVDISDLVAKAINATLNAQETKGKAKEEAKADF